MPTGQYYTVVLYLNDGSANTEYWVVPAAPTATLGQVRAQVMPATQAVQAVSKTYVDQSISQLSQSLLNASGGNVNGPLYLNGDPTQPMQAADKHYVDTQVATTLPLAGGAMTGALTLNADPIEDLQAADKRYVDNVANAVITNALPGVTISGNGDVHMNGSLSVGDANNLYASVTGRTSIAFPGLAAASGRNCLQVDAMGSITNTGAACGSGSGTVNAGSNGQIAYYVGTGTAIGGISAVPVNAGGTGASSAASALANLGGLPSSGGSLSGSLSGTDAAFSGQLKAAAISGDVNGVFSVTTYGAKGDCVPTGSTAACTDNATAIQAAIDAAFAVGGSVFFPVRSNATGQTVYYTSQAINWKGVSMYGPPGASGAQQYFSWTLPVVIRGAPGKDVFNVPDPTSGGYVSPKKRSSVRDLAIILDTSVDASSSGTNSFPNRLPGRSVYDAAMTSGSAVLTSSHVYFQPGDVGQSVKVYGAGASGADLVTTIASYQSQTQVTLTLAASTSVSSAHAYVSVLGLPVTQTIGNAAFAMDDSSHSGYATDNITSSDFTDVVINTTSGSNPNKTAGYFFQGATCPYMVHWERGAVMSVEFGMAFVPANNITSNGSGCAGIADFNTFDHMWLANYNPFLAYGGNDNTLRDVQIANSHQGVQILDAEAAASYPNYWSIDVPEIESPSQTCSAGDVGARIAGINHIVSRYESTYCASGGPAKFQWDASNSQVFDLNPTNASPINITGNMNTFKVPKGSGNKTYAVTGYGNTWTTAGSVQFANNVSVGRAQFAGNFNGTTMSDFGPPQLSRPAIAFARTADFISKGVTNYYLNDEDLWIWPEEMGITSGGATVIQDSTSETGTAMQFPSGQGGVQIVNGTSLMVGRQIPVKGRLYIKMRADSGTVTPGAGNNIYVPASGSCSVGTNTLNTTAAIYTCDFDFTGKAGSTVNLYLGPNGASGAVDVQWVAIRPFDTDTLSTSFKLGTGTAMTANHGNGTSIQHSDGTGTSQTAFFDANGNMTATAQLVSGTNTVFRTTSTTMTNAWTTTGLALPSVSTNTTKAGHCTIYWQMSSTSYTATFGLGMNNAPTNVWGGSKVIYAAAGTQSWLAFTQSATATTAISTAATAGATGTTYEALVDFVIQTGATNPVQMTIYGQSSNSSGTLSIMPGSTCYWLP
jgi:hypothetical protein